MKTELKKSRRIINNEKKINNKSTINNIKSEIIEDYECNESTLNNIKLESTIDDEFNESTLNNIKLEIIKDDEFNESTINDIEFDYSKFQTENYSNLDDNLNNHSENIQQIEWFENNKFLKNRTEIDLRSDNLELNDNSAKIINLSLDDLVFKDKYIALNKLSILPPSEKTSSDISSTSKPSDKNPFNLFSIPLTENSVDKLTTKEDRNFDNIKNNDSLFPLNIIKIKPPKALINKEKNIYSTSFNDKRKYRSLESSYFESDISEFNICRSNSMKRLKSNDKQLNLNQQNNNHRKTNLNLMSKNIDLINPKNKLDTNLQNSKISESPSVECFFKERKERRHACKFCNKRYSWPCNLIKHIIAAHPSNKPYKCDICEKSFNRLNHLNKHKTVHSDEKLYECKACQKSYKRLDHLTRHKLSNEHKEIVNENRKYKPTDNNNDGDRPYECKVCRKFYKRLDHLVRHKKSRIHKLLINGIK